MLNLFSSPYLKLSYMRRQYAALRLDRAIPRLGGGEAPLADGK